MLFQVEAGSPEASVLGDTAGTATQKCWAGTSHQHRRGQAATGPAWQSYTISLRSLPWS